jgi:DNA-binding Lrp family transcriptional regulator
MLNPASSLRWQTGWAKWNISASVVATDLPGLQTFITDELHRIEGISRTRVNVVTRIVVNFSEWALPEELA